MGDEVQGAEPTGSAAGDEPTTLTDEEIETRTVGGAPRASLDDDSDTGDAGDTGDDTGDDSDTGDDTGDSDDSGDDSGDTSDTTDTGDDSGDDSGDSDS